MDVWKAFPGRQSKTGRALIRAAAVIGRLDPSQRILVHHVRNVPSRPLLFTCIYRLRNEDRVLGLVESLPSGSQVALWALDETGPRLEHLTVGVGLEARLLLHQRLLSTLPGLPESDWLISDDDIELPPGGLEVLSQIMTLARLDVAAPAHGHLSFFNHIYTIQRPFTLVRESGYVEIGPLVILSPRARESLLPFPETSHAGWGFEAYWSSHRNGQLRSAIIDGVPVRHLVPAGKSYNRDAEYVDSFELSARYGTPNWYDLQRTGRSWRAWRLSPPW